MRKRIDLIILVVLILFIFRGLLGFGLRVANDFPLVSQESLKTGLSLPQTWSRTGDNFGEYVVSTLWSWPLDFLYGLGATLGISFSVLERIFGVFLFLTVGIFSIKKLLEGLGLNRYGKFIASLFYLTNTFTLLLIDGGQFQIALAYAIFPLVFTLVLNGVKGGFKVKLVSGFFVCFLGFTDIRFIYVLATLLFLRFFYEALFLKRKEILNYFSGWIKSGVLIILIFVSLNFYWILPAVLIKAPTLPATYQRVTQTSFLSFATLGHSLFMLQPHWYKNVFGKVTPILPEFVLIPILVFLAPILRKKEKEIGYWLLVALVGVFLVKGSNPPLPGVYPWLFTHIPGFSLFRDPTKFFFLVSLSYSVLIGVTIDEICALIERFSRKFKTVFIRSYILNPGFFVLLFTFYFLLLVRPVWLGKMTGTFSQPVYQDEFHKVNKIIEKDPNFGRVFWIPTKAPLGFSSPTHPSVEASRLYQKKPFASGVVGSYEIFNFLREADFIGEIFDIAGIKYIAYPFQDTRREELKQDNIDYYYAFLDQLNNLPWIEEQLSEDPVPLLKVKNSQDHFFLTKNTFLVVGSDGIYNELIKTNGFRLAKNALIFAEEEPSMGRTCKESFCKVILYNKGKTDFAATFIDKERFVFPAQYLDFDPNKTGWWKREKFDFLWMRNFLQQKYGIDNLDFDYGGGWAIAEGNKNLEVRIKNLEVGEILLARVMKSGKSGRIEFFQEDKKIGEIDTKIEKPEEVAIKLTGYKDIPDKVTVFDKADFAWSEVGELISDQPVTIKTLGDLNIINALAVIPKNEWLEIGKLTDNYQTVEWNKLSMEEREELFSSIDKARVEYKRISPTHYKVKIEGLERPTTLAFSESFDTLWQANGLSSFPLYSLINGFYIENDGEYDVYFRAQKYILPGVFVSATSLLILLFLVVRRKRIKT